MPTTILSESALALLRRRLAGERVDITVENRPSYRKLVDAGLMMPLHTFLGGNESAYRLTEAACELRATPAGRSSVHTKTGRWRR